MTRMTDCACYITKRASAVAVAARARASPVAPAAAPLEAREAVTADAVTLERPCVASAEFNVDEKDEPDAVDW